MFTKKTLQHLNPISTKAFLWILVLLWMVLIFCLSAQEARESAALSGATVRRVVEVVYPNYHDLPRQHQDTIVEGLQHFARKTAHTLLYMGLGILCFTALSRYRLKAARLCAGAFLIAAGYACTDEFHQLFVSGRSAQVSDVLIDSAGALAGIALAAWAAHSFEKWRAVRENGLGRES